MYLFELTPGMVFQTRTPWELWISMVISVRHLSNGTSLVSFMIVDAGCSPHMRELHGGSNEKVYVGDAKRVH